MPCEFFVLTRNSPPYIPLISPLTPCSKAYATGAEIGVSGYAYGSISTLAVGGAAAAASFGIVRALEGGGM